MTAAKISYTLIVLGVCITLFAMTLDEWTSLRQLELISGCVGLLTSVAAAIMMACDVRGLPERQ